ncbi:hypothetical protein [Sorangium sp. So ce1000]|uniref:hypothetical protein n=1 Tax=Sorangium sp. So ce1000 TaxID=3133325 RepID=UPI003F5F993C
MPYEIKLDLLPVGFSTATAIEPLGDHSVEVQLSGFVSSEDGEQFVTMLESLSDMLKLSSMPIQESMIDHLVAVIRPDCTATVYINEIGIVTTCQAKEEIQGGQPVRLNQIADISRLRLPGVEVPQDAGLIVVISFRWRKGMFFDCTPLADKRHREYDIERLLAKQWTYLVYQHRIRISDAQWEELFKQKWFPFNSLSDDLVRLMLTYAQRGASIDLLNSDVEKETRSRCSQLLSKVQKRSYFRDHAGVIAKAIEHFEAGDYISCTCLLYPRIEGVMRSYHAAIAAGEHITQKTLAKSAVADPHSRRHELSLLMPEKFRQFLEQVYFASFNPSNVTDVSRNTISHGVAPESAMSLKAALLGILIVDQLAGLMAEP